MLAVILLTSASIPVTAADLCPELKGLAIRVAVRSPPVPVHTDFTTAELQAMAPSAHRHAPLGFYRDTVGYRLKVSVRARPESSCLAVAVDAQLVEVQREIQVSSNLVVDPCLMRIVVSHYQRHAEAADEALQDVAGDLMTKFRDIILQMTRVNGDVPLQVRLEGKLNSVLDAAVARFSQSGPAIRNAVDSRSELQKLKHGCGGT